MLPKFMALYLQNLSECYCYLCNTLAIQTKGAINQLTLAERLKNKNPKFIT